MTMHIGKNVLQEKSLKAGIDLPLQKLVGVDDKGAPLFQTCKDTEAKMKVVDCGGWRLEKDGKQMEPMY